MIQYYLLNGQLLPTEQTRLQVSDLAILRGYGIFDFFLVRHGQPLFEEDYLHRFYTSADRLGLEVPFLRQVLAEQIRELIEANAQKKAGIRLVMTGGYATDSYTPTQPNLIVMEHLLQEPPGKQYTEGIALMTYPHQRELPQIKSINYLTGIRIRPLLQAKQADYVLYYDGEYIRESDRSNFFGITSDQVLITPGEKILAGITRKQVLQLAEKLQMEVEIREVERQEIATLQEAFITSSIKGVMPVVRIDEHTIGNGRPGPLTQRLSTAFQERVAAYVGESGRVGD